MNSHIYFEPLLRKELKPQYTKLLEDVKPYRLKEPGLMPFAIQWGEQFPIEEHQGILVVGQAPYDWVSYSEDVDVLFGRTNEAIFNRNDQMKWVDYDINIGKTRRSAFWRTVRRISNTYYPLNDLEHIAYSNVAKIVPEGGNPNSELYNYQIDACKKILAAEIRILSPKVVIFLTGENWAGDCLSYLGGGEYPPLVAEIKWEKYTSQLYRLDQIGIILSEHPRRKKEIPHFEAIKSLIDMI